MTIEKLNELVTGTENPKFLTIREKKMLDKCLVIINNLEEDKNSLQDRIDNPEFSAY